MYTKRCYWLGLALFLGSPLWAGETINMTDINKIKAEGMQHSQVMELNSWLSDVYGPRLTGSPNVEQGAKWAMGKMKEWGLVNVKMEPWTNRNGFERGWTNDKFYMQAVSPQKFAVPGTPMAWTPGTKGLVSGEVARVTANSEADLAKYKGKLRGKWVITAPAPEVEAFWTAPATRFTNDELAALEKATSPFGGRGLGFAPQAAPASGPPAGAGAKDAPAGRGSSAAANGAPPADAPRQPRPGFNRRGGRQLALVNARNEFFAAEGALGVISTISRGHGLYVIDGNRGTDPEKSTPRIMTAAEQYGRIERIIEKTRPVVIEADIKNTYYPNPPMFNIVGEIPGGDKADEVVMLGAHFDSWHAATGAADNGVGSCAMLEAMRILKAAGVKLRRTVRIGLWTGEEQGILGSRDYVDAHYASRRLPPGAVAGRDGGGGGRFGGLQGPLELKPEYAKFDVYLNLDNGSGAVRGVYLQGNAAAGPIFREWIEPFRSMGMTTVTIRNTVGTDHQSFDAVGLPGFQFIQDRIEYETVAHHTNMDTYERLQPGDCRKMATIVAGFAYLAANRDQPLPRKPLPATGETRSAEQWQATIDKEKPVDYDPEAGSVLGSLVHHVDKGEVHMIYQSDFPRLGELTIKFVRDNKDVVVLKGHLHSVFRESGDILFFADFSTISTGCAVVAYDLHTGKQLWRTQLRGIGPVGHSKYWNKVNIEMDDGVVRVRGYEAFGSYVEIVDAKTGKTLANRVTSRN